MPRTKAKPKPKRDRSTTVIVEFNDLREPLDWLAEQDALPGERPNISRVIRQLVIQEVYRRKGRADEPKFPFPRD